MNFIKKAKHLFRLFLFIAVLTSCSQEKVKDVEYLKSDEINLIPQVKEITITDGEYFKITKSTIIYTEQKSLGVAEYLKKIIDQGSSFKINIEEMDFENLKDSNYSENAILLIVNEHLKNVNEQYALNTGKKGVFIYSNSNEGIMRGIQSLRQLFVHAFHQKEKRSSWYLPAVQITDSSKFQHRGLMLDVCRHFFDKGVIKKYIDQLAFYKMNVLHLHLTEDQGWRIESEKYPKLNEISSWRLDSAGNKYGGFYTKEELKEIVAYAAERHITVIPEIELPGHSQAALAAYPQFACDGHNDKIEVINDWGVFKEIYCAGNDSTFIFLEDILSEVMEIFPSKYIHIGGDEAPKFRWENCSKCQKRIKDEGLHSEHELQSYFISRIEKFLNKNDRELIGWDEILEGGLSPNATVQSWRGMQGGIDAANSGHNAIMSPTSHCYLDYGLDMIDMEKIYNFDPIPKDLPEDKKQFIIGGECNMWTEHVPDEAKLDEMINPRMQALAEVLWSYPETRDFNEFYKRIQTHYPIMKAMGIEYGPEAIPANMDVVFKDDKVEINTTKNLEDLELETKWNDELISSTEKIELKESGTLTVQATKNGESYGDLVTQRFEYHKALTKPVTYNSEYNAWYTAGGDSALVDGKVGSINFRDGNWQGFYGDNASIEIDLGEIQAINSVSSNFYHYNNAWVFSPKKYIVYYSTHDIKWMKLGEQATIINPEKRGKLIENIEVAETVEARYIKVEVESMGTVPDWHEAAGSKAWIFMDEIIVK